MSTVVGPHAVPPVSTEASSLARELAASFRSAVEFYRDHFGCTAPEAVAKVGQSWPPDYEERVLSGPPDQVSWHALEHIAERNPELMAQCWERIKQAAREELESGHRAAQVMEGQDPTPWRRAQFLAIRDDLAREWRPRNGIERQMIDAMAQAQTTVFFWQEMLVTRATLDRMKQDRDVKEYGKWAPPRVSDAEAVEQAAAMVDRFNRLFLRTLRALRDLRRYAPAVIVQNAGQVNVGTQQVNVAAGGS
jgi:hypothetical protein